MGEHPTKLSILSFGVALGATWGVGVFLLGIHAWLTGMSVDIVNLLGMAYIGYKPTMLGSIIGASWGFADGFIGGFIIAIVHNMVACCSRCD